MKKKILKFFLGVVIGAIVLFLAFYIFMLMFYSESFAFDTTINGEYITGMNVAEANALLLKNHKTAGITVKSNYSEDFVISPEDIGLTADYSAYLDDFYSKPDLFKWIVNKVNFDIFPEISVDEERFDAYISGLQLFKDYPDDDVQYAKIIAVNGVYVLDENYHPIADYDRIRATIFDAVKREEKEVFLPDDCFKSVEISENAANAYKLFNELEDRFLTRITYDLGDETVDIDRDVLKSFMEVDSDTVYKKNEDGSFYISKERVYEYVNALCDEYDTYMLPRTYTTFSGDVKEFTTSLYGTKIDRTSEADYLYDAVVNFKSETHIPKYSVMPFHRGKNDIGPVYIEIDLTNQKLYHVESNQILHEYDIVSGLPTAEYQTPEMVTCVYKMATDTYLKGEDYLSHVDYWMAIYNAIGLHDASWQKKFGGNRYLRYGSHGCINLKLKDARELYESIEVGIPVIVYK